MSLKQFVLLAGGILMSIVGSSQVCGFILDSQTGEAIEGAVVGFQDNFAVTDINGFFNFSRSELNPGWDTSNEKDSLLRVDHMSYTSIVLNRTWDKCENIYLDRQAFSIQALTISASFVSDSVFRIPGAYGISQPNDWLNSPGYNVLDAVDAIPGVQVQKGALNTQRITVRGIGSRSPFSSNRIKAYFSGIPISGGDGETEIEDFDVSLIQSVELIKGPKSALYGAGLGGTIFLNPPEYFPEAWHAQLDVTGGSHGLYRSSLKLTNSNQNQRTLIALSGHRFGGWRDNSKYERQNISLWHARKWGPGELEFIYNYRSVIANIPSSLNLDDFINNPDKAADNWASVSGYEDNNKLLGAVKYSWDITSNYSMKASVFYQSYSGLERRPFNTLEDQYERWGTRSFIQWRAEGISVRAGLEMMSEEYEWMTFETLEQGSGDAINHFSEKRLPLNLFLNGSMDFSSGFRLEAGLSYNKLEYTLVNRAGMLPTADESYSYPSHLAYFLGLSYDWSDDVLSYASFGNGLSYPSLQETLLPGGAVNPDITPETGVNIEFGGRVYFFDKRFFADVCIYKIWVNDMLLTLRLPNGDSFGDNGGSASYEGLELLTNASVFRSDKGLLRSLRLVSNLNYSSNRFIEFTDESGSYDGNMLPGIPRFQSINAVEVAFGSQLQLKVEHRHTSAQFLDDENMTEYEAFETLNTSMSYKLRMKNQSELGISFAVNNILNINYASMLLTNAPAFGSNAPRYYYPGQPSNWMLSLFYKI